MADGNRVRRPLVHPMAPVVVFADGSDAGLRQRAKRLAVQLSLPLFESEGSDVVRPTIVLAVTPSRLELRDGTGSKCRPLFVDFVGTGSRGWRRRVGGRSDPLARAITVRRKKRSAASGPDFTSAGRRHPVQPEDGPSNSVAFVLDATAGLGEDAFRMACWGCRVVAVDRSAVLCSLVQDGLDRAAQDADEHLKETLGRLTLVHADSRDVLASLSDTVRPGVVYLDPMYPSRSKSALVKKNMRICRQIVGDDPDALELLNAALASPIRRVVVKRMRHAPPLGASPDHSILGTRIRYDVYVRS